MRIGSPVERFRGGLRRDGREIVGSWQMINRGFFLISLFCSRLNTTSIKNSFTIHCAGTSWLISRYYIALHVSAPKAIIRQYNLTNIFQLSNCALYMVSYNLNTYYYMHLVSYAVNIFDSVSELVKSYIKYILKWNENSIFKKCLKLYVYIYQSIKYSLSLCCNMMFKQWIQMCFPLYFLYFYV
jgi:hypothetical protein